MNRFERNTGHEIERDWKKITCILGGMAVEMCQSETTLHTHSEEYSHYDLIQHPSGVYLRTENEELFNALDEEGFDNNYSEFPHPKVESVINDHFQREVVEGAELILELEEGN